MNLRAVVLVAATACYNAQAPQGAPCVDSTRCPGDQVCVDGTCRIPGSTVADATNDTSDGAPGDRDHDGVPDSIDNCPDVANPDQGNEDGDKFGDVCDPCPTNKNDTPSDPDGDGVADPCDPHPNTPGDQIVLFEGFHHGLPTSWTLSGGTAMQSGDDVILSAPQGAHAFIMPPLAAPTNGTISTAVTVQTRLGIGNTDIGVAYPYDAQSDTGIVCMLFASNAADPTTGDLSILDRITGTQIASGVLQWMDGTRYTVGFNQDATAYTCFAAAAGMPAVTANATDGSPTTQAQLAVRAFSLTAKVSWVLVVSSP